MEIEYVTSETPIGARVKYIGGALGGEAKEGIIVGHYDNDFLVEFDEEIPGGHGGSFGSEGEWGHCWWFPHGEGDVVIVKSSAITDEAINELLCGGADV